MAMVVASDSRLMAVATAPPGIVVAQNSEQWAQAIAQYQVDREAGLKIIVSLQGRVRELETGLLQAQQLRHQDAQRQENQLFQDAQQREQLAKQLEDAQQKFQEATSLVDQKLQRIQQLDEQQAQNIQLIHALREEVQALTRQVTQEKEQVRQLSDQINALLQQNRVLLLQMQQMAAQIAQQQRQILANQQEAARRAAAPPARQGPLDELIHYAIKPLSLIFHSLADK